MAEVEFHNATSAAWIHNAGTANSSIVVASSGYADPENLPFKAVDGKYTFSEYGDGWDAAQAAPPDPPPTPGAGAADWKWDGRNGNNAVWVGCTSGGLRTYPKGEDPLWQAGVPYDSNAAPAAPVAWRNGGITLFKNGSVVVYSGQVAPPANEPLVLRFSQLVTPVRPVNMSRHFDLRWAQLGGEANYSALAAQGATVVNMHQGMGGWASRWRRNNQDALSLHHPTSSPPLSLSLLSRKHCQPLDQLPLSHQQSHWGGC